MLIVIQQFCSYERLHALEGLLAPSVEACSSKYDALLVDTVRTQVQENDLIDEKTGITTYKHLYHVYLQCVETRQQNAEHLRPQTQTGLYQGVGTKRGSTSY